VSVIESFSCSDNDIHVSKYGCVLLDWGLQCEQSVGRDTERKW